MRTTKTEDSLFKLAIILLPYDAVHYLIPSQYAPISIYPFFILLIYMVINRRWRVSLSKNGMHLITLFLYTAFLSIFTNLAYVKSISIYAEFILTFMIGIMVFLSADMYLHEKFSDNISDMFKYIVQLLGKAYYVPLIVGVVEYLALQGALPSAIITVFHIVFGGWQTGRLCMTTYEASWASMHMLIAMVTYYSLLKMKTGRKAINVLCLALSAVLFLISASAQGIVTLIVASLLYLFLSAYRDKRLLKFFGQLLSVIGLMAVALFLFYRILLLMPNTYMARRILGFTTLRNAFMYDASVFVRVGFPLIHLLVFKDHMLFGIGGGDFKSVVVDYIKEYFPYARGTPEIIYIMLNGSPTEVSIYLCALSEFGIFGAVLFFFLIVNCIKRLGVKHIAKDNMGLMCMLVAVLLALPIQFGSWSYVPFWLCLAFTNNLGEPNSLI